MQPEANTLVILSPGFPANEQDTTCLPAQQQLVQNMQENFPGLNIIVLSFHYPYIQSTYQWKNVTVVSFNGRNRGKLSRLLLWYKVWRRLASIKRRHCVMGLLSFWCTECALIGKYFGRRNKLPHFTWVLGQDAKKDNAYVKYIRPRSEELVAMSDFLADAFERNHGVRPAHVIPNGIDPRWYPKQKTERKIDVLGVGSLIKLKQYDVFIKIIGSVKDKIPGIKAMICGKGPEERSLHEQVQKLKLQENISFAGELQHAEILQQMQQAKIFLHTSSYEGFSTVCLEALYAGAHVISFCDPVKEKIPHWHIVKNDEEMLEQLIALLQDASLDHEAVMPFLMKDSASAIINLY